MSDRAQLLAKEMESFCGFVHIVSFTPERMTFRIRRKAESAPSSLFSDDTTNIYPFDEWMERQTLIKWSNTKGKFRIGYIGKVKITIIVEG